jgi:hypothetical protein
MENIINLIQSKPAYIIIVIIAIFMLLFLLFKSCLNFLYIQLYYLMHCLPICTLLKEV